MPAIYEVTIEPVESDNVFRVTWYNPNTKTKDFFDQTVDITLKKIAKLWRIPHYQLEIGEKLFRFLDGDSRFFVLALDHAYRNGETLQVYLNTCKQVEDWPFELVAHTGVFLLPSQTHLVRRVSSRGRAIKIRPKDRPLKLLFMACSPLDITPELDYEQEEEAIFQVTEKLAIQMEVEDSGSLEGLRGRLQREYFDVVHLSGHAGIDNGGQPYFIMEGETGKHRKISPGELWRGALIENSPRLLFLSGCRSGSAPVTGAFVSFARILVETHQIPAALGWGGEVEDHQAIKGEEMIYCELSRGKSILEAVKRARYELAEEKRFKAIRAWPLLRLFSTGIPLNPIVDQGQTVRPKPRRIQHVFLQGSRVQVLTEGFIGRRRQLQQGLGAFKQDSNKVGVLILGTGGLGKSCLAGKICERFTNRTLIIVHGRFDDITLQNAMRDAFIIAQDIQGQGILSRVTEMTDKVTNLCATSLRNKEYVLLLDDFEQNLEGAEKGNPGPLLPDVAELMKTILHCLPNCVKMTQLIITCRYDFTLTEQGVDLVKERLEKVWLTGFREVEERKKTRQLKNILKYSDQLPVRRLLAAGSGNPRLMERIDDLIGKMAVVDVPRLLEGIKKIQTDFVRDHVLWELLQLGGEELTHFLSRFSIYRRPVLEKGAESVVDGTGMENWKVLLRRGMSLGLIEYDQVHGSYQVTPLLRDELLKKQGTVRPLQKAAFEYYKKVCEKQDPFDPILTEEWVFHAFGCEEEDSASTQGVRLINYLRDRLVFRESRRVGEWILTEKKSFSSEGDADLLCTYGSTLHVLGDYTKAIECCFTKALEIYKKMNSGTHPKVANCLNKLGSTQQVLGLYNEAITSFEDALNICMKVYGENRPEIAICLKKLSSVKSDACDHKKALVYIKQALSIFITHYGVRHPEVADTLIHLGLEWQALEHPQKAIKCFNQALFIDRSVYGESHPVLVRDWNTLGSARQRSGHHSKAIEGFEEALRICKQVFSANHPEMAICLKKLSSVWSDVGDHEKALDYIKQALFIFITHYGVRHPEVADTLIHLGSKWQALEHPKKAIKCFEQALFIDRSVYRDSHPVLVRDWNTLGSARQRSGHHTEADKCFEEAKAIQRIISGEGHQDVARG